MAGVTSDVLNSILRSSLTDLNSFVEILNAELTEEGQGEENRVAHKDDISRVLRTFGECEAYLKKNINCLREVETKVDRNFDEGSEEVQQKDLLSEIGDIIKIIDGSARHEDDNRPLLSGEVDENKISQQLENIQDILNEYHPLKLGDAEEDGDANDEEEDRMSRQLEMMQKKAMSQLEKRMSSVGHEDDEEYAARLEGDEELGDASGDEEFDYDSLERCEPKPGESNTQAKRNMDVRLKAMWTDYKQQLANVQSLDVKQLFTEALSHQPEVDFQTLQNFSQFNDSILDLFSREAIMVVGSSINYVDPISKKAITHPVRNTICNHIYEKYTIFKILERKTRIRCPLPGCSCNSFTINDLMEDEVIASRINQSLARKRAVAEQDTENLETEDEDDGSDSAGGDTENEDTQSQELF